MKFMRFGKLILGVSVGLLVLALFSSTSVTLAEGVPCNDGGADGIVPVTTPQQPAQDPNKCNVDNAQQSTTSNGQAQKAVGSGETQSAKGDSSPTHISQELISTGSALRSEDSKLACLTFDTNGSKNDESEWGGGGQNRWYAGWGIQALNVDSQGIYKENASLAMDWR
jgi:hypothetical protein